MPRKHMLLAAMIVVIALPWIVSVTGLMPWSRMGCRYDVIDINSGRTKKEYWCYYIKYREVRDDTVVSLLLPPMDAEPNWQTVNCISFGLGHSPHYRFHGALHQIRQIEQMRAAFALDDATVRKMSLDVRSSWLRDNNDIGADKILGKYWDDCLAMENRKSADQSAQSNP